MNYQKEEAEFILAEVEALSGLTAETVRSWRRKGYLPPVKAYAKITVTELASLVIRKRLTNYGFGPAESQAVADRHAPLLLYYAVLDTKGSCEVRGTLQALIQFEGELGEDANLAKEVAGVERSAATVLVSIDGSELVPEATEELDIGEDSGDGYFINLRGLGRQLGAAAGKPLVKIQLPVADGDRSRQLVRRFPR
ncbi:MAG: hypothetical protein EON59_15630 [Alphaproteobacteria bacterium]|nr:MAG: hypothetical protein EON59_15630 [Alphaproteobacteria bacterium]